jgi:hypothetical protein
LEDRIWNFTGIIAEDKEPNVLGIRLGHNQDILSNLQYFTQFNFSQVQSSVADPDIKCPDPTKLYIISVPRLYKEKLSPVTYYLLTIT